MVKCLSISMTTAFCLVLLFFNSVFAILVYTQLQASAPLLYIEFVLYHILLLVFAGRLARTLYKKCLARFRPVTKTTQLVRQPEACKVPGENMDTPDPLVNNSIEMASVDPVG